MKKSIFYIESEQKKITSIATGRFKNYYLTGGTALNSYFKHRTSEDLDFFTQNYNKQDPDRVMEFISKKTGYQFKLEAEQDDPKLVPMKIYSIGLKMGYNLKIDFVQDFMKNIKKPQKGLHSVEDIYVRKISIAISSADDITGRMIPIGRQAAKDLYDLFYLSRNYRPISDMFLKYFYKDKAENLIVWYKSFNRMRLKMELLDLVPKVDTRNILDHLDTEILKKLPDKIIPRR